MGDIVAHRIAIGLFYTKTHNCCIGKAKVFSSIPDFLSFIQSLFLIFSISLKSSIAIVMMCALQTHFKNVSFMFLLILLLYICGDVETNPGPSTNHSVDDLSIFHINIRSLRNKLHVLENIASDYHILCVTETHLDNNINTDDICIEGFYPPYRADRNFSGGGILVYVSNLLCANRKYDLEFGGGENIWIEVIMPNFKLNICTTYRPEACTVPYWSNLKSSIERALDMSPYLCVNGDLNVDLLTVRNHVFNDILLTYNLSNVITEPTRVCETRSSLLDVILFSDSCICSESSVITIDRDVSDHHAILAHIEIPVKLSKSYTRAVWDYKHANFTQFNELISQFDWNTLFQNCTDIDIACELFSSKYLELAKLCVPSRVVTIRLNDKAWFNSDIRREIRRRDRLHKIMRRTHNDLNVLNFKRQRNKVNNMKKYARSLYFENISETIDSYSKRDSKAYWHLMKKLISGYTSSVIPPLFDTENSTVQYNDFDKAELLNNYFCSIANLNDGNISPPPFCQRTEAELTNITICKQEVLDILKILKLGKASGLDGVSHHLLKYTAETVCTPLKQLFNLSLSLGTFPEQWKTALVLPLFKNGERQLPSNYRPIALLSTVGKVFERVVFKHIFNFFVDNNLFFEFQSGFIPGRSTVHQLVEIYHKICLALEDRKHICLVFCDISKAFDRVWLKGLVCKLKAYGIRGPLLNWLTSYVTDRKQLVTIKNTYSSIGYLKAGVPQGSVLGPLLFLIYINDIADNLDSLTRLFADDTSMSYTSDSTEAIENTLNRDLSRINSWANNWLVKFNSSKTKVMFISNSLSSDDVHILFQDIIVDPCIEHKHLGITLNSDCKWTSHIANICASVSKKLSILRKLKYILDRNSLSKIYITFIRPVMEYGCELWNGCGVELADKLEKLQLEAARVVTGLPSYASRQSLYIETGWEKLIDRRNRSCLNLFYRIKNDLAPSYLKDLLPPQVFDLSEYPLRNSDNYVIPRFRLSLTNSSFLPSTLRNWNTLDLNVRNSSTYSVFKRAVRDKQIDTSSWFSYGERKLNIIHTKLRYDNSGLNYDLYRFNLTDNPGCTCGFPCENSFHFFMECPLYTQIRRNLFFVLSIYGNIDLKVILHGNIDLTINQNKDIFKAVQVYIKNSERFG